MPLKSIESYCFEVKTVRQEDRCKLLLEINSNHCWFEVGGKRVEELEELEKLVGTIWFHVSPGFRDLHDWAKGGRRTTDHNQILQELRSAR